MKKRKLFLFLLVGGLAIGGLIRSAGSAFKSPAEEGPQAELLDKGEEFLRTITDSDITFISVDDSSPSRLTYTDGNYNYTVDVVDSYIYRMDMTHERFQERNNSPSLKSNIGTERAREIAADYFNKSLGNLIVGELDYDIKDKEETGYVIFISEKLDGLETGTSGMIIMSADGAVQSAVFAKGVPEVIQDLNRESLLPKEDAMNAAVKHVKAQEDSINTSDISAVLHTTSEGVVYWYVTVPAPRIYDNDPSVKNYYVSVDALTGEIISSAEDLKP